MFQCFSAMMTGSAVPDLSSGSSIAAQILGTQSAALKGYWKCNELPSGPGLIDSSGNGNTMGLVGTPATDYNLGQPGETGNAIQFLGGVGYAGIASNIINNDMQTEDFTIFCMLKTSTSAKGTLAGFSNPSTFNRMILQFTASAGAALGYAEHGGDATYQPTGGTVNDGAWHDVCFTRASNAWTVYVDGISVGTDTGGFAVGAISIAGTYIGTNLDAVGPREPCTGLMQHVAIWSVALSGAEITAIHAAR